MSPITPAPSDNPEDEEMSSANVEHPVMQINESDSNSEDDNDYDGYELLSQDPENCFNIEDYEDSNFADEDTSTTLAHGLNQLSLQLSDSRNDLITREESVSGKEVGKMDDEHIETIKAVMKGITLPSSSLPPWATLIPEEEWKAQLLSEMQCRKYSGCREKRNNCFSQPSDDQDDLQKDNFR